MSASYLSPEGSEILAEKERFKELEVRNSYKETVFEAQKEETHVSSQEL